MDFRLTDEQSMIQEAATRFGKKWGPRMSEIQQQTLATGVFPDAWWKDFAAAGFTGALIPERTAARTWAWPRWRSPWKPWRRRAAAARS